MQRFKYYICSILILLMELFIFLLLILLTSMIKSIVLVVAIISVTFLLAVVEVLAAGGLIVEVLVKGWFLIFPRRYYIPKYTSRISTYLLRLNLIILTLWKSLFRLKHIKRLSIISISLINLHLPPELFEVCCRVVLDGTAVLLCLDIILVLFVDGKLLPLSANESH